MLNGWICLLAPFWVLAREGKKIIILGTFSLLPSVGVRTQAMTRDEKTDLERTVLVNKSFGVLLHLVKACPLWCHSR